MPAEVEDFLGTDEMIVSLSISCQFVATVDLAASEKNHTSIHISSVLHASL